MLEKGGQWSRGSWRSKLVPQTDDSTDTASSALSYCSKSSYEVGRSAPEAVSLYEQPPLWRHWLRLDDRIRFLLDDVRSPPPDILRLVALLPLRATPPVDVVSLFADGGFSRTSAIDVATG